MTHQYLDRLISTSVDFLQYERMKDIDFLLAMAHWDIYCGFMQYECYINASNIIISISYNI